MKNIEKTEDANIRTNGRYWIVEEIRPHIIEYLQEKFPDSIIEREFDNIDIMIHGSHIPVEIQKTQEVGKGSPHIANFEDRIRRQIETNKLLDHLQNNLSISSSIDMSWSYQLFKSGKLRIFTITVDKIIRELEDKDFDFIKKDEDRIILERNKYVIAYKIYKGHRFTTEETIGWYGEYEKNTEGLPFARWLIKKGGRKKELGSIKHALGHLAQVNDMLNCNMKDRDTMLYASILRILKGNGNHGNDRHARIICPDIDKILENFPGYLAKQELWNYWSDHDVSHNVFVKTVKGEYPNYLEDYKNMKSIEDMWVQHP